MKTPYEPTAEETAGYMEISGVLYFDAEDGRGFQALAPGSEPEWWRRVNGTA